MATMALFVLIFGALIMIALQVFLSLRKSKWPGWVLPVICFICAFITVFSATTWEAAAASLFLSNLPTLLMLTIYFACREKKTKKQQIDKMNIQDLH